MAIMRWPAEVRVAGVGINKMAINTIKPAMSPMFWTFVLAGLADTSFVMESSPNYTIHKIIKMTPSIAL